MRVILEVKSGPGASRKTLLGANQALRVGRTEWADFAILQDAHMSGIHFSLETDNVACYLHDLGSSNGTFLNGQPISETTTLRSGDEILAGETRFKVQIESESAVENAGRPEPAMPLPVAASSPVDREPAPAAAGVHYTVETCESGLTLCRGQTEAISPARVAALLAGVYPLYLIVDFKKIGLPRPAGIGQPEYLFDWLKAPAADLVSPLVLSAHELSTWPELVDRGWGADGVVCLFSRQDRPALLEHLRHACRGKVGPDGQLAGMLGYCWPSVMALLLAHNTPRFVGQLLTGIDATLVELPDLAETWQIYGGEQIPAVLDRLGMTHKEN